MKVNFDEFKARYLNPLTDFGFHWIFGTESKKGLLIDFLNQIIKEEGLITDIQYLRTEQWEILKQREKRFLTSFVKLKKGNILS